MEASRSSFSSSSLHPEVAFFRVTLWFKLGDKVPAIKSALQVWQKEGGRWQGSWLLFWMDTDLAGNIPSVHTVHFSSVGHGQLHGYHLSARDRGQ